MKLKHEKLLSSFAFKCNLRHYNTEDVEHVDLSVRPFVIRSTDRTVRAHSIILATGATAKRLNIPSEARGHPAFVHPVS